MKNVWPWIFGIAVGLIVIALVFGARSDRKTYWVARGTVARPVLITQAGEVTKIQFPCHVPGTSITTDQACAFYVWKK